MFNTIQEYDTTESKIKHRTKIGLASSQQAIVIILKKGSQF